MSSFYVGYQPKAPVGLRPLLRRVITGLAVLIIGLAGLLVLAQSAFPAANFDFFHVRTFEGALVESPSPMLLVKRPAAAEGDQYSSYLLVAEGKHGADAIVRGHGGRMVRVRGKLIYRDDQTMIEIDSRGLEELGPAPEPPKPTDLGMVTLTGEIVDTKCYTGVMNPGQGKVHRDCAVRCISGGIPAALLMRDANGGSTVYLLTDLDGKHLGRELLDRVGEPVTVSGHLQRLGPRLLIATRLQDVQPASTLASAGKP